MCLVAAILRLFAAAAPPQPPHFAVATSATAAAATPAAVWQTRRVGERGSAGSDLAAALSVAALHSHCATTAAATAAAVLLHSTLQAGKKLLKVSVAPGFCNLLVM